MPSELAAALAKVQGALKPIARNAEGQAGNRKHRYADLAAVERAVFPLLARNDLVFICRPTMLDGQFVMTYSLIHHPSGDREDGIYPMPGTGTSQAIGSAITYARRYALGALTGVVAEGEDDDAADGKEFHMDRRGGPERYSGWDRPSETPVPGPRPGPEHERLRNEPPTQSLWDGEDHWKDQPAGQLPKPPAEPSKPRRNGKMAPAQAIAVHFKRLGITDDTERLIKTSVLAGRTEPIEHTTDLDEAKQIEIRDELAKCRDQAALKELIDRKRAEAPT